MSISVSADAEKVMKRFFERFKVEHDRFCSIIDGITSEADRKWYTSVMLNRLMFLYFIQRKRFLGTSGGEQLDGDPDYLRHRLQWLQENRGKGHFYSFYRVLLLKLFHDGLNKPVTEHTPEMIELPGHAPYLNGGLFDVHQLEHEYADIDIPDEAFERLFDFFDEYDWHLDDRPTRADNEITSDVLGYIFEKYTNQKQMGAYYTREDITEYISKNTIIPYLFEAAERACANAFTPEGPVWSLLRENPDRYIYAAVRHGCELPLPDEIACGLHDVAQRGEWNRPAPKEYALPTETWREVLARRQHYEEIRMRMVAGEITNIDDLITCNLDIRQFAQDVLTGCNEPDLLLSFYEHIKRITVLDPTCGSGAFLFAALNILEPLYTACLEHMPMHVAMPPVDIRSPSITPLAKHCHTRYFILKSIITNNLYGVDIMAEAVEICKLRLFLKLAALVQNYQQIALLSDLACNIYTGNILVSPEQTEQYSTQGHQSFQWTQFCNIMRDGGFDVIIGNPPYVEYSRMRRKHVIRGYQTESCGNLYAYVMERCMNITKRHGRNGMIVPHAAFCTDRMEPLIELYSQHWRVYWLSTYGIRPTKLFADVDQRLAIFISQLGEANKKVFSTRYHRWHEEARKDLFATLRYTCVTHTKFRNSIPKIHSTIELAILNKLRGFAALRSSLTTTYGYALYFHNAPRYWIRAMDFVPYFYNEKRGEQISSHIKSLMIGDKTERAVIIALLNSSLFYWWFIMLSNCRDLILREIEIFPLGLSTMSDIYKNMLANLCHELMDDYKKHAIRKETYYKTTGKVIYDEFYPRYSKPLIDEIDRVLAQHYGFTNEELDFIINYDIKYRMGKA